MKEKVVVLGAGGQLGRELLVTVPSGVDCTGLVRAELDIADRALLGPRLAELSPQLVINAAAYTAVDAAESEPAEAGRANAQGPADLAAICSERGFVCCIFQQILYSTGNPPRLTRRLRRQLHWESMGAANWRANERFSDCCRAPS